jgi:dTDP-glucose pyrophosphorylase
MAPGRERLSDTTKAVILARGLGTRMQRGDPNATASPAQQATADSGVKGMIPLARPFLEYAISALADAGITEVCLVIGPEHDSIRRHFDGEVELSRVRIHFAVQPEPRGTADAVLAAEQFSQGECVLVVNSDNYYPVHTLAALRELGTGGVATFERNTLVRMSNIEPERVLKYSVVESDNHGMLQRIIEKPGAAELATPSSEVFIGMNSWSLPPGIYDACRRVTPSVRGELELPSAVQLARDRMGLSFRVLEFYDAVLDLSSRADIASVAARLRDTVPRL